MPTCPGSLEQYKLAWQRLLDAKDELDNVVEIERGPDMSAKLKECHQAENELQSVEGQLGRSMCIHTYIYIG